MIAEAERTTTERAELIALLVQARTVIKAYAWPAAREDRQIVEELVKAIAAAVEG